MREFSGVIAGQHAYFGLKKYALLFDNFRVFGLDYFLDPRDSYGKEWRRADLEFLLSRGIIRNAPYEDTINAFQMPENRFLVEEVGRTSMAIDELNSIQSPTLEQAEKMSKLIFFRNDLHARVLAAKYEIKDEIDSAPICIDLPSSRTNQAVLPSKEVVLNVALRSMPELGDDCSWESILEFRDELKSKKVSFRRWLNQLATKTQSAAEIQDEIDWMLQQYHDAMKYCRLKATPGILDILVVAPLETLENLAKLRLSTLAKTVLSLNKREIELAEAEMRAPGKECAYVFNAHDRFG